MLSNHNTSLINDLYKDYNIHLIEAKRRCGQEIKESFDVVCKYLDTLDNVPDEVKKEIKWIYKDLENIDLKYESLMQER